MPPCHGGTVWHAMQEDSSQKGMIACGSVGWLPCHKPSVGRDGGIEAPFVPKSCNALGSSVQGRQVGVCTGIGMLRQRSLRYVKPARGLVHY